MKRASPGGPRDEKETTSFCGCVSGEGGFGGSEGGQDAGPVAQLADQFEVDPNQVSTWRKELVDRAAELFEDGRTRKREETAASQEELYEQIGRLKMEVDWLNTKSAELGCGQAANDCHRALGVGPSPAMSAVEFGSFNLALPTGRRDSQQIASDAADRRAVFAEAVLRLASDDDLASLASGRGRRGPLVFNANRLQFARHGQFRSGLHHVSPHTATGCGCPRISAPP
jgi:transposase